MKSAVLMRAKRRAVHSSPKVSKARTEVVLRCPTCGRGFDSKNCAHPEKGSQPICVHCREFLVEKTEVMKLCRFCKARHVPYNRTCCDTCRNGV